MFLEHIHTPSVIEDPFTDEAPQPKSVTDPTEVEVPAVVDLVMEAQVITPDWTCNALDAAISPTCRGTT